VFLTATPAALDEGGITRDRLFFWVFLILAANSVSGLLIRSFQESGFAASLTSTFGVSAIVWTALAAGLALLGASRDVRAPLSRDVALAGVACLVALVPIANASGAMMAVVAAYAMCTSDRESAPRRAGAIFLAVTTNLIWGRLILGLFSSKLLFIDTFLVSDVIGSPQTGNTIPFIGAPGVIIVAPGCSSLQGLSLALVFWVTANQWLNAATTLRSMVWCSLAVGAAVAVNLLRMAAMVYFPADFHTIHIGWGAQVASYTSVFAIVGIVLLGARRELFA
jgi:exosortase/archaeosortase family protein